MYNAFPVLLQNGIPENSGQMEAKICLDCFCLVPEAGYLRHETWHQQLQLEKRRFERMSHDHTEEIR